MHAQFAEEGPEGLFYSGEKMVSSVYQVEQKTFIANALGIGTQLIWGEFINTEFSQLLQFDGCRLTFALYLLL